MVLGVVASTIAAPLFAPPVTASLALDTAPEQVME